MSNFKRGITKNNFIDKLNILNDDRSSYWHKMVNDKDLFIAVRNEYISVYYRGNSICELHFDNSKIVGRTHYKYLLRPDLNDYLKSLDGEFELNNPAKKFITSLNDLNLIKKSSLVYSGEEKTGVHSISIKEKNILDIEITFSNLDSKTDRLDYVKIVEDHEKLKLVFYEAKHFTNPEIRAKSTPRVLGQIEKYKKALKEHETEIIKSYKLVCKNLQELNLIKPYHDNYIKRISDGENISIDYSPMLIVFGFDQDQKDGNIWKKHLEKLQDTLKDRLKIKGNV